MPVSSYIQIRTKIRKAIRDSFGLVWDDPALDQIINEAQREYAIRSGSFIGTIDAISTDTGVFACPADFIEPIKFIGSDGLEKPIFSWRYLDEQYPDFRTIEGNNPLGIISDFDGFGKIRVFPKLPQGCKAGTLYYRRLPCPDILETTNIKAIEQHCLFQVFLLSGKSQAETFYYGYLDSVNRESQNLRSMSKQTRIRTGKYF